MRPVVQNVIGRAAPWTTFAMRRQPLDLADHIPKLLAVLQKVRAGSCPTPALPAENRLIRLLHDAGGNADTSRCPMRP